MATYYQQYNSWAPQFQQNTAYHPIHNPAQAPPEYAAKPTEYFVQESPEGEQNPPHYAKQSFFQTHFGGLRRTLRFFLAIAVIVLIVNVSWLAYAKSHYGGLDGGYGTIQRGDCDVAKKTNTWLHLLINVLSTLLLTGSNAFMSTYCCPSRTEVDAAHRRKKWLHVGMLSVRNFGSIAKRKSLIVILLCASSVPFHLLYNSLVFVSLSTNNYYWTVATEGFLSGDPYNLTGPVRYAGGVSPYFSIPQLPDGSSDTTLAFLPRDQGKVDQLYSYFDGIQKNASSWERLSNHDCIQAYSNIFLSQRRNVVLVSSQKNATDSILDFGISQLDSGSMDNNWWICSLGGQDGGNMVCQPDSYLSKAQDWSVFGSPIEYCMTQPVEDICSVEFSMTIMIVVIAFNTLKVIAMLWILFRFDAERILTSVGDAAASFLMKEDETTRGMCLADRKNVARMWGMPGTGVVYSNIRARWGRSVSVGKWALFIILVFISFGLIFFFGAWGFAHIKHRGVSLSLSSLWALGFGAAHQDAIVVYDVQTTGTIGMAILANIPQLFLALVWLIYMGIMTSMFLAADWSRFGTHAQTLMVSSPAGDQRGTWLLGAPPVYGASLLVLQIVLHWLVSQSIFVISIAIYNPDGSPSQTLPKFINCGYSPIAIVFAVITSAVLTLSAIGFAFRRFPQGGPPVAATCSAAISAACHLYLTARKDGMVYETLRWGHSGQADHGVAHCSLIPDEKFRNGHGQAPIAGWMYAGTSLATVDASLR